MKLQLAGESFGRLSVIEAAGVDPSRGNRTLWRCRCSCGNESIAVGYYLTQGKTRSCGCLKTENVRSLQSEGAEGGPGLVGEGTGVSWRVIEGDCVEAMSAIGAASCDAIVTDPPYGQEFMGKAWDRLGDVGEHRSQRPVKGEPSADLGDRLSALPNYNASANVRCRRCGHWRFSGTPCKCAAPDFPNVRAKQAEAMQSWHLVWALEALRALKPGGHLVAFGGTRTFHRLTCALEDAGFEIRDCLSWLYSSGFPKSLDVSKAIDKAAGATRKIIGPQVHGSCPGGDDCRCTNSTYGATKHAPATAWMGWGTALKPAWEPIILARKPLAGTVAANVLKHGTGALNIDACRIESEDRWDGGGVSAPREKGIGFTSSSSHDLGRWPPNVVLGCGCRTPRRVCLESPFAGEVEANTAYARKAMADSLRRGEHPIASHLLYTQPGILQDEDPEERRRGIEAGLAWGDMADASVVYMDRGVSRGMEQGIERAKGGGRAVLRRWLDGREELEAHAAGCAQARLDAQSDTHSSGHARPPTPGGTYDGTTGIGFAGMGVGQKGFRIGDNGGPSRFFYTAKASRGERHYAGRNTHPTVKPVDLMRWLVRLVTPPGGLVLDPFAGSGTTGIAALAEGFRFIGIERDAEMVALARRRIAGPLFAEAAPPPSSPQLIDPEGDPS